MHCIKVAHSRLLVPAGLPPPEELKGSIEVVLQQLKQDMESKAAALRAVQSKHSGTEALLKSTRSQLQAASDDCKGLQKRIQQCLAQLYHQACSRTASLDDPDSQTLPF